MVYVLMRARERPMFSMDIALKDIRMRELIMGR